MYELAFYIAEIMCMLCITMQVRSIWEKQVNYNYRETLNSQIGKGIQGLFPWKELDYVLRSHKNKESWSSCYIYMKETLEIDIMQYNVLNLGKLRANSDFM